MSAPVTTLPCATPTCHRVAVCENPQACGTCLPEALGITYRQLSHWTKAHYLNPENRRGTGTRFLWPEAEAEIARRMGRLVRAGIVPSMAAYYARNCWPSGLLGPGLRLEAW